MRWTVGSARRIAGSPRWTARFDEVDLRFTEQRQEMQLKQHVAALQSRIEEIEQRLGR
jgi:hypothetical protein